MARVLAIVSGSRDPLHDAGLLHGVRLQVLNRYRVAQRVFSVRAELSDCALGVQSGVPRWGAPAAFIQRWVQWDWRLGVQLCVERCRSVFVSQLLREDVYGEEEEA